MRFYTGSYTRMGGPGVGVCRWENGQLSMVNACHDLNDTTFVILSHDQRTLYAVGSLPETGESAAASYRVAGDSLELLSCRAAAGKAACHQAESADGRFLYAPEASSAQMGFWRKAFSNRLSTSLFSSRWHMQVRLHSAGTRSGSALLVKRLGRAPFLQMRHFS